MPKPIWSWNLGKTIETCDLVNTFLSPVSCSSAYQCFSAHVLIWLLMRQWQIPMALYGPTFLLLSLVHKTQCHADHVSLRNILWSGPWWSSGQRARLLLLLVRIQSRLSLQFLFCKLFEKNENRLKRDWRLPIKNIQRSYLNYDFSGTLGRQFSSWYNSKVVICDSRAIN